MSSPSHGIGDTSSSKSRPSSLDTCEANKQQSEGNTSYCPADQRQQQNKQHEDQSHQRRELGRKKRYTPSITVNHHQDYAEQYNRHQHHYCEGKENLPSPKTYSQDAYYHAPAYDYGPYMAHSYYYPEYKNPYHNEKDWYNHHVPQEGYHYHGHSQPYHYSNGSVASGNINENGSRSYQSGKDCRGYSYVDHTYRDFSGVPPTDEDRERYNNKKKEFERRLKEQTANSSKSSLLSETPGAEDVSCTLKKKRGRGNRATKNESGFIGFMGTNFPARLHDLLSHEEEISDIITWLPHGEIVYE